MVIAVNTRFLLDELEGYGYFIHELFQALVKQHPDHQFYFLFDRQYKPEYVFAPNVQPLVVAPPARHPLLWKLWYDIKVPLALRKIKADVFVSPDGFCSLTTRVPQCLVVHDLGFLHHPEAYKSAHVQYLKRKTPKFIREAKTVITVSNYSKQDIIKQYRIEASKISVVYNGVKDVFHPVSFEEKQATKEKYSGGNEYFLYAGAIQPRKNLVNLLKAFSVFKRRLQTNMKLIIAGRMAWKNQEFLDLVEKYKYKSDVILTGYLPEAELAPLMAGAYAFVYPSLFEGFGVPVAEAMKSGVPVLTSRDTSMQEAAGDGALYFDPSDYADIADKMMTIYKDEGLRNRLVEKGARESVKYNWQRSAEEFFQVILKTAAS